METLTVDQAIARGARLVTWPTRGILALPAVILLIGRHYFEGASSQELFYRAIVVLFVLCFVCAWLWWSVQVPKWRLWAYQRVNDIAELKRRAIAEQLTWPDGSIFARTEIKSTAHAALERELEQRVGKGAAT